MEKPTTHKKPPAGAARQECCTDLKCESGLRNNYFEGKRLTPDSFRVEQRYLVERRRLLNRAVYGWGVVYGYGVTAAPEECGGGPGRLKIGAGLALDECGRELLQVAARPIALDEVIAIDEKGRRADREQAFSAAGGDALRACWLLSVHYAEQSTGPVAINDPCSCERREYDHTCETVRYSLRRIDCDDCCRGFDCELECGCGTGRCCEGHKEERSPQRGGCRCLCEHLTDLLPGEECGGLCVIEEPCGSVRVDLRHGVPLACLGVVRDACERWTFGGEVEACGPRRLVKRNDLLFDLIRGCDLTRIIDIGWKDWHRREEAVSFDDFSQALGSDGDRQNEYVTRDFWVTFSRPVREDTLRPDCFAMTVMSVEREGGWWQTFRVPIVWLDTTFAPPEAGDPAGHVRGARVVVDGAWVEDGVRGRRSLFIGCEARVEIEIRGDFIVDCNGQTIDANAVGLSPVPTGNGSPGGSFLSSFRVAAAREAPARAAQYDTAADRLKGASS